MKKSRPNGRFFHFYPNQRFHPHQPISQPLFREIAKLALLGSVFPDDYFLAALSTSGSRLADSLTWVVEHEKAKRICPAPAGPKAEPGAEPMAAWSIR
jgi:hypothetical protein